VGQGDVLARQAQQSDWLDAAARAGLVAYGLVHVVIGWLALQLALGDPSESASANGAIRELAEQQLGLVLVWLVAVGMFLLMIWRLVVAAAGHRDDEGFTRTRRRAVSAGRAVVYGYISWAAASVATGSGSSNGGTDSTTAKVMDLPAGQLLVGAVGVAIAGIGVALIRKAWTERFAKEMDRQGKSGPSGTLYIWLGKFGCVAKGIAFGIVGGLFVYAAGTHEPNESGGLDQALSEVLRQPLGPYLLGAIALGITAYGLFCFAQARYFDTS
jgi:uncharacterized protein DUF1206